MADQPSSMPPGPPSKSLAPAAVIAAQPKTIAALNGGAAAIQQQMGTAAELPQQEHVGPPVDFWQQPWVQTILPFATSLTVHAAILIIGLMVFGAVKLANDPPKEDQLIIPDSNMVDSGPPGGIPNIGLGGDPLRQTAQDKDPTTETKGWADKKGPSIDVNPSGATGDTASVFDAGAMSSVGAGHGNNGNGTGDGSGALAMFGTPGGGGIGPKGPVFGNGGNARFITFVCDASGSMINKMASLKDQLNKAITGLKPVQSFNIIFFQDNKCDAIVKEGLVPATPENKRKAGNFLEGVTTTGTTDPIPGIEMAFKTHPQLIYLLTDGDFPDNEAVLRKIRELNKDRKVKINTIAFVGASDSDTEFLKLLETIAKENGGTFKHVNEGDL